MQRGGFRQRFRSPFCSCVTGVRLYELALMCQRGVSQLRNTLRNGASTTKRWISKSGKNRSQFAAAKRWYLAAKWHSCANEGFRRGRKAVAKWFRSGDRFSQREEGFSQLLLRAAKFFRSGLRFSQRPPFGCEISQPKLSPCF